MQFSVGQKLWYVPYHRWDGQPREATVTKVGRKWVYINVYQECRFAVDDPHMGIDGGSQSSPGRCYTCKEEYDASMALKQAWSELWKQVDRHNVPDGITVEDIQQARWLLKLEKKQ